MIIGSVPLNYDPLNSDLVDIDALLDSLIVTDSYTDQLIIGGIVTDFIQEVSSFTIGSLYVVTQTSTLTSADSYTDNLTSSTLDTLTEVSSLTEVFVPGPGNETDFLTVVDSYVAETAFVLTATDLITSVDSLTETIISVQVDNDILIETSFYVDVAEYLESPLDVLILRSVVDEFLQADVLTMVDDYEANTFVGNVNSVPISALLPEKFIEVPFIADMLSAISNIIMEPTHEVVDNLRRMRTPTLFEIFYAEKLAGSLGFYQDITNNSDAQKRRIIESLTDFYTRNGTVFTFSFLSFIADEFIQVVPLYTQDHVNFSVGPLGLMYPDGPWYLSSCVDLEYSLSSTNLLDIADIHKRFYQVAPVPLVLRSVSQSQVIRFDEYDMGVVHMEIEILFTNGAPV